MTIQSRTYIIAVASTTAAGACAAMPASVRAWRASTTVAAVLEYTPPNAPVSSVPALGKKYVWAR
ncbi:hypothetical protein GALL_484850 [mine drainage metagenome]|uniref:Uncharacterized protein n=1 Tax=mine drainage metagenome TaxID=410659 RepID=A0A1J5PX69_9ZZZZ